MIVELITDFAIKFVWNGLLALIIGALSAICGNFIPRERIDYYKFPFRQYKFEMEGKLYRFFKIENWKLKLPDISEYITSVFPKTVNLDLLKKDGEYFVRFAKETCISEFVHVFLILISPLYLFLNWDISWGIGVMLIDIVVNIPFIMIQRYNRPRLVLIAERSAKRAKTVHTGE